MAARVKRRAAEPAAHIPSEEKIARLLALLVIKDIKVKDDQVPLLRAVGFEISDIADLLGMTPKHVSVAHSRGRKRRKTSG